MIWLLLLVTACAFGVPEHEVPRAPAGTEHVRVLHAHGSGSIGMGVADEVVRHNLGMLEACAVEAALPPGTCSRVRFEVKLPRHGSRVAWVTEDPDDVEPFTACLTRELQSFRFPSPETAAPGSMLEVAIAVASPSDDLDACARRTATAAP